MSNERRTLTPAQFREHVEGSHEIAPGMYLDRLGRVHFSVPEVMRLLGLPDTPANRAMVNARLTALVTDLDPDAQVVETTLED